MNLNGALCLLFLTAAALADVTPIDAPLKEDGNTEITVKYEGAPVSIGKYTFKPPAGEYHYNLYVPPDYGKDPKELYPVVFVQMPGGNANAGKLKAHARTARYIVVGLVEAKNGPWEPIVADFCAAHDDVIKRCHTVDGFKFMTGFSGGARSSTLCSELRPGFGGVLLQGASFWPEYASVPHNPAIGIFQAMGATDGNAKELPAFHKMITPDRALYQMFWDSGHAAVGEDIFEQGFEWLEQWCYFGVPTQKDAKPMYLQQFARLQSLADAATGDFEKYELLEKASNLATARGLTREKDVAAALAAHKKALADLAKNETVKKELAARTAYQKIADAEYRARRQAAGDFSAHKRLMADAATAYDGVARKNPGTVYGEKATKSAERCKAESQLEGKPAK